MFGIPGGPIIPLYEAFHERPLIRHVLTRHEGAAAFMADAYARASGGIGVCCTTTGPGATNALTGIAVAHADHIPVLLITAQVPTDQFGRGAFQESGPETIDLAGLFKGVTKWSGMVHHPSRLGAALRQALRAMRTGRPGPAHLSVPLDFLSQRVPDDLRPPTAYRCAAKVFDRAAVSEAARQLLEARRPVLLAGHGAALARASDPLRRLAERLSLPVATTFKAKGVFPEEHPLSLGLFGYCSAPEVQEYLLAPETDLLLVIGSGLGETATWRWDSRLEAKRILQADVDPEAIGRNFPVSVGLVGDAKATLLELYFEIERRLKVRPSSRPAPALPRPPLEEPAGDAFGVLKPQSVFRELRAAVPKDALVFVDNGTVRTWAARHFPVSSPETFFVNMGMASMGYATAGAVGAQLARPDRPVLALVGDAAFAMNGMEVHTAVEADAPVVWVVVNNGGHAMIHHGERMLYGGRFSSSLFSSRVDAARIAEGLGALGYRVEEERELADAVGDALRARRPAVIDVAADLHECPPMGARVRSVQQETSRSLSWPAASSPITTP